LLRVQTKDFTGGYLFLFIRRSNSVHSMAQVLPVKNDEVCKLQICSFLLIENLSSGDSLAIMIF
jgi:hypothetical protein